MGLKQLGQTARVVQRVVHGVEQRQIAQLGTTVCRVGVDGTGERKRRQAARWYESSLLWTHLRLIWCWSFQMLTSIINHHFTHRLCFSGAHMSLTAGPTSIGRRRPPWYTLKRFADV